MGLLQDARDLFLSAQYTYHHLLQPLGISQILHRHFFAFSSHHFLLQNHYRREKRMTDNLNT